MQCPYFSRDITKRENFRAMKATVISALKKILKQIFYSCFPDTMAKRKTRRFYDRMAEESAGFSFPFLNYGYAVLDDKERMPKLASAHEPFRLCIQLYHHVASQIDLKGLEILEVGSGRGGGAYYMKRYLKARKVVGVDLSRLNVDLSRRTFELEGLSFRQGDAEALPFENSKFDAVVNVESSHTYPNLARFFLEVERVLRRGGHFLYADCVTEMHMAKMKKLLKESTLRPIKSSDITANVVESLTLRSERLDIALRKYIQNEEQYRIWANWSALVGTPRYSKFRDRKELYMSFVLQKC